MRVLFSGSRTVKDHYHIEMMMAALAQKTPKPTLICGMAEGVDTIAHDAAEIHGMEIIKRRPNWASHDSGETGIVCRCDPSSTCRAAALRRNWVMVVEDKPDVVFAYVDKPLGQSKGTKFTAELAISRGIPTYITKVEG